MYYSWLADNGTSSSWQSKQHQQQQQEDEDTEDASPCRAQDSRRLVVFTAALCAPLSALILLGNLVTVIGIAASLRRSRSPAPSSLLLLSLAAADLMLGGTLSMFPRMGVGRSERTLCVLQQLLPNFAALSLLANLVAVHAERFVSVARPLRHGHSTFHRLWPLLIAAAWVVPLTYSALPALGWNDWPRGNGSEHLTCCFELRYPGAYIYVEIYGLVVPGVLAMAVLLARVLCIARHHVRSIDRLERSANAGRLPQGAQRARSRQMRALALSSIAFCACWLPYLVFVQTSFFVSLGASPDKPGGARRQTEALIVLTSLAYTASALVPLILVSGRRRYTRSLLRLLPRGLCRSASPPVPSTAPASPAVPDSAAVAATRCASCCPFSRERRERAAKTGSTPATDSSSCSVAQQSGEEMQGAGGVDLAPSRLDQGNNGGCRARAC